MSEGSHAGNSQTGPFGPWVRGPDVAGTTPRSAPLPTIDQVTLILPIMSSWNLQMYLKVPAASNLRL